MTLKGCVFVCYFSNFHQVVVSLGCRSAVLITLHITILEGILLCAFYQKVTKLLEVGIVLKTVFLNDYITSHSLYN